MDITNTTMPAADNQLSGFAQVRRRTVQLLTILTIVHLILVSLLNGLAAPQFANLILASTLAFTVVYLVWLVVAQAGRVDFAASGLVITLLLELYLGGASLASVAILLLLVISTLISSTMLYFAYTTLTFVLLTLVTRNDFSPFREVTLQNEMDPVVQVGSLAALLAVTITVRFFRQSVERASQEAERTAGLLRISADVGQVTAGVTTLDELLPRAVNFIQSRFGYYHVQVFLLDDSQEVAELRASTGEVGQRLLARKHRLNVGSASVIGQVTKTGEPLNYNDTQRSGVHYRNELLPDTRAELALPIRDGERIIGALDVQSTEPNAFGGNQVQSLQIMTNLLAASIRNARLFEAQQVNIQENQRLYIETQANLREIQRLNRELTLTSWDQYTEERGGGTAIAIDGNRLSQDLSWAKLLKKAQRTRKPISEDNGRKAVAVPITLRGHTIGAIEIEPDEQLAEADVIEIARAVSERLAVNLDNARLFEESQETTRFEQRINEIVGQYQSATSVDELLQITIAELSDTLGAQRSAIRLSTLPETPDTPDTPPTNGSNGANST
jgi:putative methionine-R-sulfoxide reductase with GAF domain